MPDLRKGLLMTNATPEFRKFSAECLRQIYPVLDGWLAEWATQEGVLSPPEYPFSQSLDEVLAAVDTAVQSLEAEPEPDTGDMRIYPSLSWLEDHGIETDPHGDPMTWKEVAEGYAAITVDPTLKQFREMVTAFEGGYHPDTNPLDYVTYPEGYTPQKVDLIERAARVADYNLYAEALSVLNEVHTA